MKNTIFYFKQLILSFLLCFVAIWANAQNQVVKGTVKDVLGEAVIGANVTEVGTTNGTITDINGDFSLNVSPKEKLRISFIGYQVQTVDVAGRKSLEIVLKEDTETLDEVVVVGYGTAKKRDLTGAITQVKAENLMATAPTNIQEALRGKAAGVMVAGGGLNDTPMIRIRGNRSISASNEPLFVIDGVPVNGGSDVLNPSDVASIEILKDASATAIYGARGANGVILVTTKKGEVGKVNVEYNGYLSIGKVDEYRRVRNGAEYLEYLREADRNYIYDGEGGYSIDPSCTYPSMTPNWEYDQRLEYVGSRDISGYVLESVKRAWEGGTYDPSKLRTFDWQGAGMRDETISQNHNISIRGGNENTKVFISGSFMDNKGITPRSYRKRYTLRMNLDQNLGKYITMGATTNFAYWEYFNGTGVGGNWNPLGTPYYSPGGSGDYGVGGDITQDGDPALGLVPHPTGEGMLWNPFYDFTGTEGKTKRNRIDATLYAMIKLNNGLSYRVNFGTDYYSGQEQMFYAKASTSQGFGNAKAEQKAVFDRGWTLEHILSYAKTFGQHSLNLTAVQSAQKFTQEPLTASGVGIPLESQLYYNLGSATTQGVTSNFTQWTLMSWMGRAIYGFKDNRYMVTASLRYDGSSRLADGHKWVAFPSVAVAWRISSERFMEGTQSWLDDLKLRFSYGTAGNNNIPSGQMNLNYVSSATSWINGFSNYWAASKTMPNSDLKWETTVTRNVGLDYTLFGGKLTGSIEYYKNTTKDLLIAFPVSGSGYDYQYRNLGKTENKGFEISLTWNIISKKNYELSFNGNVGFNKNKVKNLGTLSQYPASSGWASTQIQDDFIVKPGHSVGEIYGYVTAGRYEVSDFEDYYASGEKWVLKQDVANNAGVIGASYLRPGALKLKNIDDSDNVIDEKDRTVIGNTNPKASGGFALSGRVYGFDLSANFTYSIGNDVYNANKIEYTSSSQYY